MREIDIMFNERKILITEILNTYPNVSVNHHNMLNNMITTHRKRIHELQSIVGCQSDFMMLYNTGVTKCPNH